MFKVWFYGNLGGDPERRYTAEGQLITSIRVAYNTKPRRDSDEKVTTWLRVVAFGTRDGDETWLTKRMESLQKGDSVFVAGQLEFGKFERQDGSEGTSYDIRFVDELHKIDWGRREERDEDESYAPPARQPAASGARGSSRSQPPADNPDLEDLPF